MKKRTLLCCILFAAGTLYAQEKAEKDSIKAVHLQDVEVSSLRATETTPVAFTNISKEEIKKENTGVDFPYLVNKTPGALTTSDAGAGIGYTTLRVRGTDGTRINVTANGIPINDAESHTVFWVNLPDLASSVKDIQIQRGAGTSTNGAGAFGASINMQVSEFNSKPYAELSASGGSFNTHKATLKVGTGLIDECLAIDARLSSIGSDGYIDRAETGLKSYYLQGSYFARNTTVRLITFAGEEETYHAWNYASKEEMEKYGRRYNSCGYMFTDETGKDHYYDDQTDNYKQQNYQLLVDHTFSPEWNLYAGLHYTKGDGYYQEYKGSRKLVEYALQPFEQNGTTVKHSDLVRKKAMDNHFGGGIFSLNYKGERLNASLGGALNRYVGDHFGQVLWVKEYSGSLTPNHEYYRNQGRKTDGNIYLKGDYKITKSLNAYADIQYRHISYDIDGNNDKWNDATDALQRLAVNENFNFVNPKAGLSWQISRNSRLFGSVSMVHKEPTRNNYTDGKLYERPKAERLLDYELGYTYSNSTFHIGANLYFMDYKDQLVLTGELNEIGEPLAANVPDSYRAGIELMAGIKLPCGFSWEANATFSRNRVKDFTETLYEDEWVGGNQWKIEHGDTPIAFSPDIIVNNILGYSYKGFEAQLHSQYVSKQYMSNSKQSDHILDAYFVSNLRLAYTFKAPHTKGVTIGVSIYNLFDHEYENNGYAGSGFYMDGDRKVRYNYAGYAAQAGTNALGHISISL
ncbi:MAG: TonB-dependent receptor [Bacteroidaceae bacterium]|nr:TonB-dependent receptor [Bacteroidaceae bacterium]